MPVLEVQNLTKKFGPMIAVDSISFSVEAGEILVIVGGSGCGKTTTLRCIAGLEEPTGGAIRLDGEIIASSSFSMPPERRGIGMVFQSYALWPHMTIFQNVAYGMRAKRLPEAALTKAVTEVLAQVGLSGFEDRFPSTLSGGQQQRVALARSAIVQPKLLLLDEPLSNLDAKLREQMRDELKHMIKLFNMTAVHITHDQDEAMALADRIICMRSGRIEQSGTGRELYRQPASRFVADFIGACSFVEGKITPGIDGKGAAVRTAKGLEISADRAAGKALGAPVVLAIRPEAITLSTENAAGNNRFAATIESATFLGSHSEYQVAIAGASLKVNSPRDFDVGMKCFIHIDPTSIACIDAEPAA